MLQATKSLLLAITLTITLQSCKTGRKQIDSRSPTLSSYTPFPGLRQESLKLSSAVVDISQQDFVFSVFDQTVYRFFNPTTGAHLYTVSEVERDYIIEKLKNFSYEGKTFLAVNKAAKSSSPVYRFYNTQSGVHFYTINENEKVYIEKNLSHFNYEGVAYYAFKDKAQGAIPLHRFYRPAAGIHFFTPSENERKYVAENLPHYNYENIAFYAFPKTVNAVAPKSFSITSKATTNDNTPNITWQQAEGATSYEVLVSKKPNCTDPVFSKKDITGTFVDATTLQNGSYYVCVGAVNSIRSFRTARNNGFKLNVQGGTPPEPLDCSDSGLIALNSLDSYQVCGKNPLTVAGNEIAVSLSKTGSAFQDLKSDIEWRL